ncbi:MAG TPA: protein translocase subunit SecD [Actinomycetota bacterium]|nr:protein translocase subunit SecD [Actinomycetota bacterium]
MAVTRPARLGLDLRGGTQIVLEAADSPDRQVDGDTLARTLEVLRRRVDQLGVAEPTLQRSGDRRVIVELPGVYDPKEAVEVIGRTAQLAFHPVLGLAEPEPNGEGGAGEQPATTAPPAGEDGLVLADEGGGRLRLGPAAVTGEAVGDARAELDPQFQARWQVAIEFQGDGGRRWAELTGTAACQLPGDPTRRVAIVLDRQVISSPQVDPSVACEQGITGGQTVITGDFTDREAQDLALLIRAGALPVPVEVVEQRTVGPTLGEAAIRASVQAAVVGAALTMLYMIAYYRLLGGMAAVALLAYGLLSFAVLLALRSTLTLPGIAGFVLAIGMAVDANVLVFERMREEHRAGAGLRRSLDRGFSKALSAIADASITTLLAAGLLFFLASGAVRGFGVTLSVGVLVSLFTALVVTRVLVELVTRAGAVRQRPGLLGLEGGSRLARWLATRGPDLVGRARWWLAASLVALVLAAAGLVVRGPNFGVEFTGGRLLEYRTERPVDLDAARQALAEAGHPRAVVQASGEGNLTVRTGQLDEAGEEQVQRAVTEVGGQVTELRDEFIGPTIGAELRRKALIALGIALVVQLGYLAVRFRWTFGAAAVVAMFHDVAILLGLFAWLGKPLDGVFLAALLTVIGYSVNDSVVVFDRIRERLRARTREPLDKLANDACLQTIPRTVNTGLGALFILAALFVLGGDTLTDFALALLVGILVGTYSSVFVATPLLVAFEGRFGGPPPAPRRPAPAREPVPAGTTPKARDAGASRQGTGARPRPKAPRPKPRPKAGRRGNGRRR